VCPGPLELSVHVGDPHLDDVGDRALHRWLLLAPDVRDYHRTVLADLHLGTVVLTDPDPLHEAERFGEPRHRGTHVRVHEHRYHRGRWYRSVLQHAAMLGLRSVVATRGDPLILLIRTHSS